MINLQSLLAVIPSNRSHSPPHQELRRFVMSAIDLGKWLHCEVHLLAHPAEADAVRALSAESKLTKRDVRTLSVIQPTEETLSSRISRAIEEYSCGLLVCQDGSAWSAADTTESSQIIESSLIPVLLLPGGFDFHHRPPESLLVPLSGDKRTNEALGVAMALATRVGSFVDFLHVTEKAVRHMHERGLEALGDQQHHEYRQLMDKVVSEANPCATQKEQSHLRHFYNRVGFTTSEILRVLRKSENSVLVLEWKGSLALGHAQTIKELLLNVRCPTLLVRGTEEHKSVLRVGEHIRSA